MTTVQEFDYQVIDRVISEKHSNKRNSSIFGKLDENLNNVFQSSSRKFLAWGVLSSVWFMLSVLFLNLEEFSRNNSEILNLQTDGTFRGLMTTVVDRWDLIPSLIGVYVSSPAGILVITSGFIGLVGLSTFSILRKMEYTAIFSHTTSLIISVMLMNLLQNGINLSTFLCIVFVALSIPSLVRFYLFRETEGVFKVGLLLGLSFMCSLAVLPLIVFFSSIIFLSMRTQTNEKKGLITASLVVTLFPSIVFIAGMFFLQWRFTGELNFTIFENVFFISERLLEFSSGLSVLLLCYIGSALLIFNNFKNLFVSLAMVPVVLSIFFMFSYVSLASIATLLILFALFLMMSTLSPVALGQHGKKSFTRNEIVIGVEVILFVGIQSFLIW